MNSNDMFRVTPHPVVRGVFYMNAMKIPCKLRMFVAQRNCILKLHRNGHKNRKKNMYSTYSPSHTKQTIFVKAFWYARIDVYRCTWYASAVFIKSYIHCAVVRLICYNTRIGVKANKLQYGPYILLKYLWEILLPHWIASGLRIYGKNCDVLHTHISSRVCVETRLHLCRTHNMHDTLKNVIHGWCINRAVSHRIINLLSEFHTVSLCCVYSHSIVGIWTSFFLSDVLVFIHAPIRVSGCQHIFHGSFIFSYAFIRII